MAVPASMLIAIFALSVWTAGAQLFVLPNPAEFQGPTTLLDFEESGDGTPLPRYNFPGISDQWLRYGVSISDSTPENGAARYASTGEEVPTFSGVNGLSYGGLQSMPGGYIDFTFMSGPSSLGIVQEAGIWTVNGSAFGGQPSTVTFFDFSGQEIESITSSGTYFFAGLHYDAGIASVRISDPDYFLTDNLQFSPVSPIPEPSTCTLLGTAVVAYFALRRRWSQKA